MRSRLFLATAAAAAGVLACATGVARADEYIVDHFPEGQQIDNIIMLRFIGPIEGTITGATLFVDFTTAQNFRAEDLTLLLVAPAGDGGNESFWFLTGEDLGWFGHGSFSRVISTDELNGQLSQGLWANDVGSIHDPPAYSGTFSDTSRYVVEIEPIPEPAGGLMLGASLAGMTTLRRRR